MCTVTIIPQGNNGFILTSNRDEAPDRIPLSPDFYTVAGTTLLFPKDKKGGTWIGISEKHHLVCVLNGGFVKHTRQPNYRKSRGVVANDFMISDDIVKTIKSYNLNDIEPFTMVIVDWSSALKFYELVWDGEQKHIEELPLKVKIWSSSTLYNQSMQKERKQWFDDFESRNDLDANTLLEFHKNSDTKNKDYGIIMDRGFVKTTSVTQVSKLGEEATMRYEDLEHKTVTTKTFNLTEVVNG